MQIPCSTAPRACAVLVLLAVSTALAGCLEHRERIEIAEDGTVEISVFSKGNAADLADNSLVPSGGPWRPQGKDVVAWSALAKPSGVDAPFDETPWQRADGTVRDDVEIGAVASFRNVGDLPRSYAASDDPYGDAGLHVTTTLDLRTENRRRVYVFVRTYHAVPAAVVRIWKDLEKRVGDRIQHLERLWGGDPLTADEKRDVAQALSESILQITDVVSRDALAPHYVRGAATLPLADRARVLASVRDAVGKVAAPDRLVTVLDAERARASGAETPPPGPEPLVLLDREFRAALRAELRAALDRAGVSSGEVNGILRECELALVASDRAQDLGDESFRIDVVLPGTIVGGNYVSAEGGVARFRFDGGDLHDQDVVLRAVSCAEPAR